MGKGKQISEELKKEATEMTSRATQMYIATLMKIENHYGVDIPKVDAELPVELTGEIWIVSVQKKVE